MSGKETGIAHLLLRNHHGVQMVRKSELTAILLITSTLLNNIYLIGENS